MSTAAIPVPAEGAAPPKSRKKLLIIVAAVALLAGGGGTAWFLQHRAAEHAAEGEDGKAKKVESGKPPVFSTLENFTVNLAGGDHFLQLGIVLQLKDGETAEKVKAFLPQIRSGILLLLSAKSAEELESAKGKQALIDEVLEKTRAPLGADGEKVQAVLLGSMLIQ